MEDKEGEAKPEIPWSLIGLGGSVAAFAAGLGLLLDDAKDFGKLDSPEHPSPLHHWQWGLLLMLGGAAGIGICLLDLLSSTSTFPPPPTEELPPSSFLEQAIPVGEAEKLLKTT